MTSTGCSDRVVSDPIGLITDLVAAVEHQLTPEQIRAVAADVAGGRAKSRRLASALAERPAVLADGRSPAPRAIGDLLVALRHAWRAGGLAAVLRAVRQAAADLPAPRPGLVLLGSAGSPPSGAPRAGRPGGSSPGTGPGSRDAPSARSADSRDPVAVIHGIIAELDPGVSRDTVAAAVRHSAPRPSYQQKLAWALEDRPALLTGEGHLAPLRAIPRFIEALQPLASPASSVLRAAAVTGSCASTSRWTGYGSAGRASRTPASSSALAAEPAASQSPAMTRTGRCARTASSPTRPTWRAAPAAGAAAGSSDAPRTGHCVPAARRCPSPRAHLRPDGTVRHLPLHRAPVVPGLPASRRRLLGLRPSRADRLRDPRRSAVRRLHPAAPVGRMPGLHRSRPPARPLRPLPDPQAARHLMGPPGRSPAARAAGAPRRNRRRRAPGNRDALADQAIGRTRAVRPCRGPDSRSPTRPSTSSRHASAGTSAADPRRRRRAARAGRGNDPARGLPCRPRLDASTTLTGGGSCTAT